MSDKKDHREFCKRINQGGGQVSEDENTNFIPSMRFTNRIYDNAFGRTPEPDDRTEEEIRKAIKDEFIKAYGYGDILDRLTGHYTEEEREFFRKYNWPPEDIEK